MTIKTCLFSLVAVTLVACTPTPTAPVAPTTAPAPTSAPAPTVEPSPTARPAPTSAPAATAVVPTPAPASAGSSAARDALVSAIREMVRIGKFRVKIPDNTTTGFRDFKAEVVLPDHVHVIATLRSIPFEVINIGRTAYIKRGTGWISSTSAGGTSVAEMAGFMREEGIRDITNVVALGADSVDGAPTKVYAFNSVYALGTGPQQYHVKAWISDASNTIVKSESTNAAGVTSTTRIEMDPTITVVAPI